VDSQEALDPNRPIKEADMGLRRGFPFGMPMIANWSVKLDITVTASVSAVYSSLTIQSAAQSAAPLARWTPSGTLKSSRLV
jgi:hypothetical protein